MFKMTTSAFLNFYMKLLFILLPSVNIGKVLKPKKVI
jgi:hypothetical protein